jgi:hypothetical protein
MKRIRVEVTRECIRSGKRFFPDRSPVALGLRGAGIDAFVGWGKFCVYGVSGPLLIALPKIAVEWIGRFDGGEKVPVRFKRGLRQHASLDA